MAMLGVVCSLLLLSLVAANDLPDCVCKQKWTHNEFNCNRTLNPDGHVHHLLMKGCPSLKTLSNCEVDPQQSWCRTTEAECKQQVGDDMLGDGWAFCTPETGQTQLPSCTCATVWLNGHGSNCATSKRASRVQGCPTLEELQECDPDYKGQSWCLTNDKFCLEQEDCPGCSNPDTRNMTGAQWAYCDPDTQRAELPDCTCEDSWEMYCPELARNMEFGQCPSLEEMKKCNPNAKQPRCKTDRARCKQQAHYLGTGESEDISPGSGFSFCNPKTNKATIPTCECLDTWTNDEIHCEANPLEMKGCPSKGELRKCESLSDLDQNWCKTTYDTCEEQNYESEADGWVYCKHDNKNALGTPELADCECMDVWTYEEYTGPCSDPRYPVKFHGCPTKEELSQCEEHVDYSWCMTKDFKCKQQDKSDNSYNQQWVTCDPNTQLAVKSKSPAAAIGITFIATIILCSLIFVGVLYGYRAHIRRRRAGYSADLLNQNSIYPD